MCCQSSVTVVDGIITCLALCLGFLVFDKCLALSTYEICVLDQLKEGRYIRLCAILFRVPLFAWKHHDIYGMVQIKLRRNFSAIVVVRFVFFRLFVGYLEIYFAEDATNIESSIGANVLLPMPLYRMNPIRHTFCGTLFSIWFLLSLELQTDFKIFFNDLCVSQNTTFFRGKLFASNSNRNLYLLCKYFNY